MQTKTTGSAGGFRLQKKQGRSLGNGPIFLTGRLLDGASADAGTALHALALIDFGLAVLKSDRLHGAGTFTRATADAGVDVNLSSHSVAPPSLFVIDQSLQ